MGGRTFQVRSVGWPGLFKKKKIFPLLSSGKNDSPKKTKISQKSDTFFFEKKKKWRKIFSYLKKKKKKKKKTSLTLTKNDWYNIVLIAN